jgi:hypothetical protein
MQRPRPISEPNRDESAAAAGGGGGVLQCVLQPVPAFDEVCQPVHEPRRRGAIHDIVVERDREAEDVARLDPLPNEGSVGRTG